ncbi:hypothetical protein IWQ62_000671 [Dispira parvispora]|uniref:Uncharacterized protein n=1 Tax=Dispira parvispora TaxID=1520584 RepID=A0A9W8E9X3_9FUNG|nr:hypothetical protein IWQ62_000671 [Dispira parvispora]
MLRNLQEKQQLHDKKFTELDRLRTENLALRKASEKKDTEILALTKAVESLQHNRNRHEAQLMGVNTAHSPEKGTDTQTVHARSSYQANKQSFAQVVKQVDPQLPFATAGHRFPCPSSPRHNEAAAHMAKSV